MCWNPYDHWRLSVEVDSSFEGVIEYKFLVSDDNMSFFNWDQGFNEKIYAYNNR